MRHVTPRRAGWLGISFVVLLFLSAGVVTLPASSQPAEAIAAFYAAHRAIILVTQALGLVAAALFIGFADGLGWATAAGPSPRPRAIEYAGLLVAAAAVLTAMPVIALALSHSAPAEWLRMTDWSDAVLFLAMGLFGLAVTLKGRAAPVWLRLLALLVGLVALARSLAGFLGLTSALDAIAPLAFMALVLAAAITLLPARRPLPA